MELEEFPISENMEQCPCCDYYSLAERGKCLVCPVCFWEDDCLDPENPDWDAASDLNDDMNLRQARSNFEKYGAWKEEFSCVVISAKERRTLHISKRNV
ncbi:CPCC family cysteine-rich protein [Microbulbifer agarilyticus]|uniref:CPCC family cysteine-rich protein n=1 Tax=Microbulbifer agarilyticus TaxID=260552 RepID=UPI00384F99DC